MIDKLNSTFKTDFYHKNREQKQENSVCAPVQNHHHTDAKIPAATYRAYHGISFKGRQKNDEAALITACRSAIDSIEKTSPSDTVMVKEAVEILKPLNLSEQKLLDYLLGCSYDSHNENVEINKHAVYYALLLNCDYRDNVPLAKIPHIIATSLDNENKCFSEKKFDSLFAGTGQFRMSKKYSLKRLRETTYPEARKVALVHKSKLSGEIAAVLKEEPVEKNVEFDEDIIFSTNLENEKQYLKETLSQLKSDGQIPDDLFKSLSNAINNDNFDIKGVYTDYYSLLNDCKTLDDVKTFYPEIKIPDLEFEDNGYDKILRSRLAKEDINKIGLDILKKLYLEQKPVSSIIVDMENSYPTTYISMINSGIDFGKVPADIIAMIDKTEKLKSKLQVIETMEDKDLEFMIRKNASKKSRIWAEYIGITNKYWHPVRAIAHKQIHPLTSFYQTDKLVDGYLFYLYKYQNKAVPSENPFEQYADGTPFNYTKKEALEKIYFLYKNNFKSEINSKGFLEFKKNFDTEAMAESLTKLERHYKNTFSKWFMTDERRKRYEDALDESYRLVLEKMEINKKSHKMDDIKVQAVVNDKLTSDELVDYIAETETEDTEAVKKDYQRIKNIIYAANNPELTNLFNQYVGSDAEYIDGENFLQYKYLFESCIQDNQIKNPEQLIAKFKLNDLYMSYLFKNPESDLSLSQFITKNEQKYKKYDGSIDYSRMLNDLNAKEEYELLTTDVICEEKSQLIYLLDKKFIAGGKKDYNTALSVITMYDNLPDMFKNRFYALAADTDKINDEIFVQQLRDMYSQIAAWNLDEAEIITMDADKIPQQIVITSKAKYELLDDCNGNLERFDSILNKFYSAAQKRVGDKQGQGVKVLGENVKYAAELKILGSQAIGSKRLYARTPQPEDIQKYGNVKYVFDTLEEHL